MDTLRTQYREEIRAAYFESEHQGRVDYKSLNKKIKHLMRASKVEGLPQKEFEDLIKSTLPPAILSHIENLGSHSGHSSGNGHSSNRKKPAA